MSDITERLRRWTHAVDAVPASDLMDEAADEIERLRLTDAEREAVAVAMHRCDGPVFRTLRGLLGRIVGHKADNQDL